MKGMIHELKIQQQPFNDLSSGDKTSEVRNCSDRTFKVGDTVKLGLVDEAGEWKHEWLTRTITHIQTGYGLPEGLCVLSYAPEDHFKEAYLAWQDKTDWVQDTAAGKELGMHRADVLKQRIDYLTAELDKYKGLCGDQDQRASDIQANTRKLFLSACETLGMIPDLNSWFDIVEELKALKNGEEAFNAVISFILQDGRNADPLEFLRLWNEGGFDELRKYWPEAPQDVYLIDPHKP